MPHYDLPVGYENAAGKVLDRVLSEIHANAENGDQHSAEDMAADVVQRLYHEFRVRPLDDGMPGPLRDEEQARKAAQTFVIARFETRHFTFEGVGSDELMARLALTVGWNRHADATGAERNYITTFDDSIAICTYTLAHCYRDTEEI